MPFPTQRLRRLRSSPALSAMVRETVLSPKDFVLPLFVRPGKGVNKAIGSMPGHSQISVDKLKGAAKEARALGVPAVILFGIPDKKDGVGSEAYDKDGIVKRAVREL